MIPVNLPCNLPPLHLAEVLPTAAKECTPNLRAPKPTPIRKSTPVVLSALPPTTTTITITTTIITIITTEAIIILRLGITITTPHPVKITLNLHVPLPHPPTISRPEVLLHRRIQALPEVLHPAIQGVVSTRIPATAVHVHPVPVTMHQAEALHLPPHPPIPPQAEVQVLQAAHPDPVQVQLQLPPNANLLN